MQWITHDDRRRTDLQGRSPPEQVTDPLAPPPRRTELGFTDVDLSGTRTLTAKFATQPTPVAEVTQGLNFLVDNDIELVVRGTPGAVSGILFGSVTRCTTNSRPPTRIPYHTDGCVHSEHE